MALLKQFFISVSYHILVASLTLMARAIIVRRATSIGYNTLMKKYLRTGASLPNFKHMWVEHEGS